MGSGAFEHLKRSGFSGKLIFYVSSPWVIFFTALAIRLIHITFLKEGFYFSDFEAYDRGAHSLMAGQGFGPEYDRPPLYPLFLAANYLIFGVHLYSIRIIQALLGAFSSVLVFFITDRILGKNPANIAAWISVFYPYYIFIAGLLYPTLITTFFLICMIYFLLLSVEKNSIVYSAVASVCLGIASLAVPVCLAFLPFLILWFLLFSGLRKVRALLITALYIVVSAAILSPWALFCYNHYGRFVLIDPRMGRHLPVVQTDDGDSKSANKEGGKRFRGLLESPDVYLGHIGSEFIRFWSFVPDRVITSRMDYRQEVHQQDPRMVVDHPFTSSLMNWLSILTYGPVFILALAGIVFSRKHWRLLSLPLLLLLSHALGYAFFFAQTRYRLPVEFCLMILAAGGACAIWNKFLAEKQEL